MRTTYEVTAFIRSVPDLHSLIQNSEHVCAIYRPRSSKRSQTAMALNHFWASNDGAKFRIAFERHSGGAKAPGLLTGAGAKVKAAVFNIILEHRMEKGLET